MILLDRDEVERKENDETRYEQKVSHRLLPEALTGVPLYTAKYIQDMQPGGVSFI